ncbi:MAG: LemA family protein, partial [Armatimonadetes bacterium]|nr:LemA family protein [Armatimonadota bacterium]
METSILLGLIFLVVIAVPIGIYNGLVSRRNSVDNAFASLDANLQKRFDLIPNLVATVKGYATIERDLLEAVVQLRGEALRANSPAARLHSDGAIAPMMTQILALGESYPELKASANFGHLQRALTEIEEQISASRRAFNAAVNDYNTALERFPGNLFASPLGFARRDFYAAAEAS